jgi:hypothetical protein
MLKTAKKIILANQLIEFIETVCKISRCLLRKKESTVPHAPVPLPRRRSQLILHRDSINSINWFAKINFLAVFNIPNFSLSN